MHVHGSCHCGRIAYEADVEPELAGICHCTDCQTLSGTGYRVAVPAPPGSFRLLGGTPRVYVKTADRGAKRRHSFCGDCGSPVHSCADSDDPPFYMLRIGCLRERASLAPKRRIWCRSALDWSLRIGDLPGTDGQ